MQRQSAEFFFSNGYVEGESLLVSGVLAHFGERAVDAVALPFAALNVAA